MTPCFLSVASSTGSPEVCPGMNACGCRIPSDASGALAASQAPPPPYPHTQPSDAPLSCSQ
eukprot:CAMPEP_0180162802 /NCGR_PEP_ID=MMETSP0986-20121125/29432_1 /TAXON_ID=697907 /ORGANISM="non described non described, Strain CCMP2293" /LENGTH=60 /DNA_ID=CAMNT_0022113339 /DNA_START=107 /DNA_END=290 /DNA_ORIENTATION=+